MILILIIIFILVCLILNKEKEFFETNTHYKEIFYWNNFNTNTIFKNSTLDECKTKCTNEDSCTAYMIDDKNTCYISTNINNITQNKNQKNPLYLKLINPRCPFIVKGITAPPTTTPTTRQIIKPPDICIFLKNKPIYNQTCPSVVKMCEQFK